MYLHSLYNQRIRQLEKWAQIQLAKKHHSCRYITIYVDSQLETNVMIRHDREQKDYAEIIIAMNIWNSFTKEELKSVLAHEIGHLTIDNTHNQITQELLADFNSLSYDIDSKSSISALNKFTKLLKLRQTNFFVDTDNHPAIDLRIGMFNYLTLGKFEI